MRPLPLVIGVLMLTSLACGALEVEPPDLAHPRVHRTDGVRLNAPGNWTYERVESQRAGRWDFRLKTEGLCYLLVRSSDRPIAADDFDVDFRVSKPRLGVVSVSRWGAFEGHGERFGIDALLPSTVTTFREQSGAFVITEVCDDDAAMRPGFALMEESFEVMD